MESDQIQRLASAIANDSFKDNLPYWLVLIALALIGVYFASRWGSYAKKRGETDAVDADLKRILRHVEETTKVTEGIRSVVSLGEWSVRELRTLRRIKLEELLGGAHRAFEWSEDERDRLVFEEDKAERPSPMPMVMAQCKLYFPELFLAVRRLEEAGDQLHGACRQVRLDILRARVAAIRDAASQGRAGQELDLAANQAAMAVRDNMNAAVRDWGAEMYRRLLALDSAAADLMATIIAVPENTVGGAG